MRLHERPLSAWHAMALARELAYVPQLHQAPFPYRVREVVLLGRLPSHGLLAAPAAPTTEPPTPRWPSWN